MTERDLKNLMARVQSWPQSAQDEFVSIANEIEGELHRDLYVATSEELKAIDEAIASIDAGEFANDLEVDAVFAKFRGA